MDQQHFFDAIRAGNVAELEAMLAADPALASAIDPSTQTSVVLTALYVGKPEVAEVIARHKLQLDVHEAAALGRLDVIKAAGPEQIDQPGRDGFHPLSLACFFNQPETAEYLIAAGADVDAVANNPMRIRPIHAAAARRSARLVRALLTKGADPNARQHKGYTALHAAAQHGDTETAQALIDAGAELTLATDDGKTAADIAAEAGHRDLAARLNQTNTNAASQSI